MSALCVPLRQPACLAHDGDEMMLLASSPSQNRPPPNPPFLD
jgi:hypothetical protein